VTAFHSPASFPELAWATGADEADIRVLAVEHLGIVLDEGRVPYEWIGDVHDELNPSGERTVPEAFGYGGEDV
jgi:hypothetical protein